MENFKFYQKIEKSINQRINIAHILVLAIRLLIIYLAFHFDWNTLKTITIIFALIWFVYSYFYLRNYSVKYENMKFGVDEFLAPDLLILFPYIYIWGILSYLIRKF